MQGTTKYLFFLFFNIEVILRGFSCITGKDRIIFATIKVRDEWHLSKHIQDFIF